MKNEYCQLSIILNNSHFQSLHHLVTPHSHHIRQHHEHAPFYIERHDALYKLEIYENTYNMHKIPLNRNLVGIFKESTTSSSSYESKVRRRPSYPNRSIQTQQTRCNCSSTSPPQHSRYLLQAFYPLPTTFGIRGPKIQEAGYYSYTTQYNIHSYHSHFFFKMLSANKAKKKVAKIPNTSNKP